MSEHNDFFEDGAPAYDRFLRDGQIWGYRKPLEDLKPTEIVLPERITRVKMPSALGAPYNLSAPYESDNLYPGHEQKLLPGQVNGFTIAKPAPFFLHNEAKINNLEAQLLVVNSLLEFNERVIRNLNDVIAKLQGMIDAAEKQIKNQGTLLGENRLEITQLRFLLGEAPMIDATDMDLGRLAHAVTKYAYINPLTFARISERDPLGLVESWYTIKPSPTRWVLTALVPVDRVIFTPNPLPGGRA